MATETGDAEELQRRLFEPHSIVVVVHKRGKIALVRASFHVYNGESDLCHLVEALVREL